MDGSHGHSRMGACGPALRGHYPQQVILASPPLTYDHCHWATCLNGTKTTSPLFSSSGWLQWDIPFLTEMIFYFSRFLTP